MVTFNRIDLFLRGASEVLEEYKSFKNIDNLFVDDTFSIYYPLPRSFLASKLDSHIIKRIEEGLFLAYKDGSLDKLFEKYYQPSVDFLEMNKRKIYKIENPFLKGLDKSYEKYFYDFLKLKDKK